jgi:hypothetical protein
VSCAAAAFGLAAAGCSAGDDETPSRIGREGQPPNQDPNGLVTSPSGTGSEQAPNLGLDPGMANGPGSQDTGCGQQSFNTARRPAEVLLVLDRSASMLDDINGDEVGANNPASKWALTVPALTQVIQETTSGVDWGMKMFPDGNRAGECSTASITDTIHVPIAPMNGGTVVCAINAAAAEGDGTPTGDALNSAVRYLNSLQTDNDKYIVLATDGEPSCSPGGNDGDSARPYAVQAVNAAVAAGIPVFVIGVATTKASATQALNDMAIAGTVARKDPNPLATRYYLANTTPELVASLRAVTGEIATCVFPLSKPPPVPDNIGVRVSGSLLNRDPNRANGWEYTGTDLRAVEVFGDSCNAIKAAAADTVEIIFGCPGVPIR